MKKKSLKALLIKGFNAPVPNETIKLYNGSNCLIIGNEKEGVSIEDIEKELKEKDFVLDNTRIDILVHGVISLENPKHHFLELKEKEYTRTKEVFTNLKNISNGPLNVQLWSCYSSTANKDITSLEEGSSLVTHTESSSISLMTLSDFSRQKSLERYFSVQNMLTPEEQFVNDFPENFETMTFSKVERDNKIIKYKTTRFLKDTKIAELVEVLKDSSNLTSIIHNDIELNKKLFCANLPVDITEKVKKTELNLNKEQILNYVIGRLIHSFEKKDFTKANTELGTKLLELLKNKGLDLTHQINGLTLLHCLPWYYSDEFLAQFPNKQIFDNQGYTPLHYIAGAKDLKALKMLLKYPEINVNAIGNDCETPLHFAVEVEGFETVKELLKEVKWKKHQKCRFQLFYDMLLSFSSRILIIFSRFTVVSFFLKL
ncbi:MAG TPA: ankyrin repeat domain-containing protein [Rickettsia endosymbiont of Omalisus fontisbellaquei]|nr:ankyrin repeat domain-containing protein [Rickettsia endosymbiont of Omalisus fontisbellaquei]